LVRLTVALTQVYELGAAVGLVGKEVVLGTALGHIEDGGDDGREVEGDTEGGRTDGKVVRVVEGSGEVLGTLDGTVVGRFDDGKLDGMVELGKAEGMADGGSVGQVG
jgi:hypothetical protein